jgi:uncharacterized LabA/DUF88 family protein
MSIVEPHPKRACAFFDGQNLFHQAKDTFGYHYPNYDPILLANHICNSQGWNLAQTRFYTGVPDASDNKFWNHFWTAKLLQLSRQGVHSFSRPLRYRNKSVVFPDGTQHTFLTGDEKGIDVRIALDIISLAHSKEYDVALIFSQDQDLSEVANEIRIIAKAQSRWIKIASAFPVSPTARNRRGINNTDWIKIDRQTYDTCLDPRNYRPKHP